MEIAVDGNIPPEIIEEILVNLPAISLFRFSAVSKSWEAMISDKIFIRLHKIRASLPGREMISILRRVSPRSPMPATTLRLSSTSSNWVEQPFICPLQNVKLLASCSDMWCVEKDSSMFLLNPSMGTCKKLPPPLSHTPWMEFCFGVGFDSLADDYKILKLSRRVSGNYESELYSLRSNSWRRVLDFPKLLDPYRRKGVFVSNALHWILDSRHGATIVSFDLSTETYSEVANPPFDLSNVRDEVDRKLCLYFSCQTAERLKANLTVLRGKLCLYLNYHRTSRFYLWEMQEYGDEKSWRKMMVIIDVSSISVGIFGRQRYGVTNLTPLYLYHNGMILMKAAHTFLNDETIFMVHKDEPQIVSFSYNCGCPTGPLYVESLVSPATY